jgi:hypothetical protein
MLFALSSPLQPYAQSPRRSESAFTAFEDIADRSSDLGVFHLLTGTISEAAPVWMRARFRDDDLIRVGIDHEVCIV